MRLPEQDTPVLIELAERIRAISESEQNRARRDLWYAHDEGRAERPLVLTENDAGIQLVLEEWQPQCESDLGKQLEYGMTEALMHHEVIGDDRVVEPVVNVPWKLSLGNYGVEVKQERATDSHGGTAGYHWDAPIKDLEEDFHKLRQREFSVDREATLEKKAELDRIFDGILDVRIRGRFGWSMGLTQTAVFLIGLEELMVYMYEEPDMLHRFMAFLRDDHLALIDWAEREELFTLNNENDYIGSGSIGYTRALPRPDKKAEDPVRATDLWALIESQETVGVGPKQFEEFIFPYQQTLAKRFGRIYYGCCEPVHNRWHILRRIPNLKRVSISPWCDQAFMAEAMGRNYVFSRKPAPSLISTDEFNEDRIRADLMETLDITARHGCPTELVMKDVHTLAGEPDRLTRWTRIARECIEEHRAAGG